VLNTEDVTTTRHLPTPIGLLLLKTQEPAPRNEDVQEKLRRLQNQVAQLGRRLQNAPESSQLDSGAR